jgi:hypothetical protein
MKPSVRERTIEAETGRVQALVSDCPSMVYGNKIAVGLPANQLTRVFRTTVPLRKC